MRTHDHRIALKREYAVCAYSTRPESHPLPHALSYTSYIFFLIDFKKINKDCEAVTEYCRDVCQNVFGPGKLPGLSRNGPQDRSYLVVEKTIQCQIVLRKLN